MSLKNEQEILHLLYYRNKNQHRQAIWWKYLSILHRRTNQLVNKVEVVAVDSKQVQDLARFLLDRVIPASYIYFRRILAQGQFIPLGFALIACTARLRSLLEEMIVLEKEQKADTTDSKEDLGEVIAREESSSVESSIKRVKKMEFDDGSSESIRKKKKKKRTKNAIDEIFGF